MFLRKGVVWKNYDRESVLYDLENDSTLTLNETSTRILKEVLVYKNEYQKVAMNLLIENQECEYDDLYGDVMECCNTLFATPYFTTDPENAAFISLQVKGRLGQRIPILTLMEEGTPQNIFSTLMAGAYDYLEIAKSSEEYRKKIEDIARWNWYLGKYGLKEK